MQQQRASGPGVGSPPSVVAPLVIGDTRDEIRLGMVRLYF